MKPVSTVKSGRASAARNNKLKAAGSGALALAALIPPPGMAQSYDVANETELGAAVQAANASAGASATINLTGGFTGQGIPAVAKPITFDLHGFSMTGTYTPGTLTTSGTITLTGPAGAGLLTLSGAGAIRGADAGPAAATNGGIGLFLNTSAALVNATTIVGGTSDGAGGAGTRLLNNSTLVNSGTIAGGQGLAAGGGQGAQLERQRRGRAGRGEADRVGLAGAGADGAAVDQVDRGGVAGDRDAAPIDLVNSCLLYTSPSPRD